jgi:hypothetical protein
MVLGLLAAGCASGPSPETQACYAALSARSVAFEPTTVDAPRSACEVEDAVRVSAAPIAMSRPVVASCSLVATLDSFEREIVQPAALRHFGRRVVRVEHMGAWSCRRQAGWFFPRWSEHAKGKAIDVSGFELADGRRVTVAGDWSGRGAARDFLREVARSACGYFAVVLTPKTNRDHRDHFHLDIGPHRACDA